MNEIKDVKTLLKMLRSQGVLEFSGMGITVKLGELPQELPELPPEAKNGTADEELSEEELLLWSAGN